MTAAELQAWRAHLGLSREAAARLLGLSLTGFLGQLYNRRPVSAQTERLTIAVEAMTDALSGWHYIRQTHGDLYGVGWGRVEKKLTEALNSH